MKKTLFVMVVLTMIAGFLFAGDATVKACDRPGAQPNQNREEEIFYQMDFEDGWGEWTHVDGTLPASMWHLDDLSSLDGIDPPGGTGNVWWMGDPVIGGYIDHLYVVLDTPVISLGAAPEMSFDLNVNCEDPAGATAPYDGWDGCNVRISTDNGATWNVLSGTPGYTCESMYSFGLEHGEGPNVPGWGGDMGGWQVASFDLSAYANQDVMIRWAFASDPAYSTADQPDMFGMMIDNIVIGSFSNDAESEGNMTYTSIVPVGGDIWHIDTIGDAPSPTHAAVCQNDQGSYNPGMLNWVVSPTISLPTGGDIRADFMLRGYFMDADEFPEVDYFHWDISPNGGINWYAMSNPYNDPNGNNYVYSDAPDIWSSMTESYSLDGFISDYAGQDVMFRIGFQSDQDTPDGEGIMIDDFIIYVDQFLPSPQDLVASLDDYSVQLNWESPFGGGGGEGWINWDSGNNSDGIGTGEAVDIDVAAKFLPEDLTDYTGSYISTVKFFPKEATADYTIYIWTGANGGTEVYSQAVPTVTNEAWNEVDLDTPVEIAFGEAYWIGYEADTPGGYPCGCDEGPSVPGRGSWIRQNDGAWSELPSLNPDLDYNWNIQAYVAAPTGEVTEITPNRDLTGYNVYRATEPEADDPMLVAEIDGADVLSYLDDSPEANMFNYYRVTAVYDDGESPFSNEVEIFVPSATAVEYTYDDGTAESALTPMVGDNYAMKYVPFIHPDVGNVLVMQFKVYIEEVGNQALIIRGWDDDGEMGMPGTQIFQVGIPASQLQAGWNLIMLDDDDQFTVEEGAFYLGIMGSPPNASTIGIDESNAGNAYNLDDPTAGWMAFDAGQFMWRAIVDAGTGAPEEVLPGPQLALDNYPNPFNPTTQISLNIPETGNAALRIYNVRGQLVRTLFKGNLEAGTHQLTWQGLDDNGSPVSSGVYFYKLETGQGSLTRKMMLLK